MPRSGTLVICVQNLDFSGANQVVLNVVTGRLHESNVVVLSPKIGSFAARFIDSGAAVRTGVLSDLLKEIKDVFCIFCNTIMTANIVVEMASRSFPIIWILHEWWDDVMMEENLRLRNLKGLTLATVKEALQRATQVVFVCEAQRLLYKPTAASSVIFVGVTDPIERLGGPTPGETNGHPVRNFTVLCLGIVCPRKNQLWTVELFKLFARGKSDVRLVIVGARRTRLYEISYLAQLEAAIGGDPQIELHDVTDNVDAFFSRADCLMITSLNEVTPMVISEAMSWSLPVLSTNIAGIPEMFSDGVEGFLFSPGDSVKALSGLEALYSSPQLTRRMGQAARATFEGVFDLNLMVAAYQRLVMRVAPLVVLLDLDGVLADWDEGFYSVWDQSLAPVNRTASYFIEQCVSIEHNRTAELVSLQRGFYEDLQPIKGALRAVHEMEAEGYSVYLCTTPSLESQYCAQEKLNWIRRHLGEKWLKRTILTQDKTLVRGDVLIDDKPYEYLYPGGRHSAATWKQVLFDQPYNRQLQGEPVITDWAHWRPVIQSLFHRGTPAAPRSTPKVTFPDSAPRQEVRPLRAATTVEEVQQKYAQLQLPSASEPLSPEDIASILSGSVSLLDEDDLLGDLDDLLGGATEEEVEELRQLAEAERGDKLVKKQLIRDRLCELSASHKREAGEAERRCALDSEEAEGVQVFRPSYHTWQTSLSKNNNA